MLKLCTSTHTNTRMAYKSIHTRTHTNFYGGKKPINSITNIGHQLRRQFWSMKKKKQPNRFEFQTCTFKVMEKSLSTKTKF